MGQETHNLIGKYLPTLQSTAERITGSFEDAQDIVQDTLEKWFRTDQKKIENHKSYLVKSLINNCQTHLRNLKSKREQLDRFQENFLKSHSHFEIDFEFIDHDGQVKRAVDYINQKLKPLEQGVFILREVFNLEYEVIQEIVGKKAENCRQVLSRAKSKIGEEIRKGEEMATHKSEELMTRIKEASMGKFQELFFYLNPEIKNVKKFVTNP